MPAARRRSPPAVIRCSRPSSSNRHSSTLSATSENGEKLVPPPSYGGAERIGPTWPGLDGLIHGLLRSFVADSGGGLAGPVAPRGCPALLVMVHRISHDGVASAMITALSGGSDAAGVRLTPASEAASSSADGSAGKVETAAPEVRGHGDRAAPDDQPAVRGAAVGRDPVQPGSVSAGNPPPQARSARGTRRSRSACGSRRGSAQSSLDARERRRILRIGHVGRVPAEGGELRAGAPR